MNSLHVLPIQTESFVMLVKQLKKHLHDADIFEIWLDTMRVKGDLAVIQKHFNKPMIAKSSSLDLLKRGVKSGMTYADVPHDLEMDLEFTTLAKNKDTQIIRSYHNFELTPQLDHLHDVLKEMDSPETKYLKVATHIITEGDIQTLLDLLDAPRFKGRLIVTGMGDLSRELRVKAPFHGSVFYYAPIHSKQVTAPGQLTREELEKEWEMM